MGVCELVLPGMPKASRGRRPLVLDALGGARVLHLWCVGIGGMCRAAAGANGLGFVGLDLGFWVRGASPVSRGRRHLCARCGGTRESGVFRVVSLFGIWASHSRFTLMHSLFCGRSFRSAPALSVPPVCPVVLGFRSVGSRVAVWWSSWAGAVSCTSCRVRGPS